MKSYGTYTLAAVASAGLILLAGCEGSDEHYEQMMDEHMEEGERGEMMEETMEERRDHDPGMREE